MSTVIRARDVVGIGQIKAWRKDLYFAKAIFALRLCERPGLGKVGVDDGLRLFYDPDLVLKLGPEWMGVIIAHEIRHVLFDHGSRSARSASAGMRARYDRVRHVLAGAHPALGTWERFWNVCGDFEINHNLTVAGWKFPPHYPPARAEDVKLDGGLGAEEYVRLLIERAEKEAGSAGQQPQGGSGQDGDGEDAQGVGQDGADANAEPGEEEAVQGDAGEPGPPGGRGAGSPGGAPGGGGPERAPAAGAAPHGGAGQGDCGGCAGNPGAHEAAEGDATTPAAVGAAQLELMRRCVAQDILAAAAAGRFPLGAELEWAKERLKPPTVDWRKVLANKVRLTVSRARGNTDLVYGPPSRRREIMRQVLGDEAPLMSVPRGPEPQVLWLQDTSGSMYGTPLERAMSEGYGLVRAAGGRVFAAAVDADVYDLVEVRSAGDLKKLMVGGGGTDMRLGIEASHRVRPRPEVVVMITDGITPWWDRAETPANLVLVVVGDAEVPKHLRRALVRVPLNEGE